MNRRADDEGKLEFALGDETISREAKGRRARNFAGFSPLTWEGGPDKFPDVFERAMWCP